MGRLRDKVMGTRYPAPGTVAVPVRELRASLLALGGSGVPFSLVEAGDGLGLVAMRRVVEPATGSGAGRRQVEWTFKISMRLVPGEREVRALHQHWAVTRAGDPPGRTVAREQGSGPFFRKHRTWTVERGPDGRRRGVEEFALDSRDMKDPLRDAVVGAGWTWRGVGRL